MAFELTELADAQSGKSIIQPQLVLEIDGVDEVYSLVNLLTFFNYGESTALYGDPDLVFGGLAELDTAKNRIILDKSTTKITQQLEIDKARGSSISSLKITLADKNGDISRLITPGEVVEDILGRRAKVKLGFAVNTSYPMDYITVFRGVINDVVSGAGYVEFFLASPEQKKKVSIFPPAASQLNGAINNSVTTLTLDSTTDFVDPTITTDPAIEFYVRIDDEIIKYTGKTSTTLTGCTRGALTSINVSHDDNTSVSAFYRLQGDAMELALKLMLSHGGGPAYCLEDTPVTSFEVITDTLTVSDAIYFDNVNVEDEYGITVGDYVTTTGASNGANNVSLKVIASITVLDFGSYIVLTGVNFVNETGSNAVISFRSRYDTLGIGMGLCIDEVDVDEHELIQSSFLSSFNYDIYVKEEVSDAKAFLENEIYAPASAFTLPRKSRASVGYNSAPIPTFGETTVTLNEENIINGKDLKLKRSLSKNFYNAIIYKFDEDSVLDDKFRTVVINTNTDSLDRIDIGNKPLTILSKGMRASLSGVNNATIAGNRRLDKYKFGAEYIDDIMIKFSDGFNIEVGDNVIFDGSSLNVTDTNTGERGKAAKLFTVVNKSLDFKKGVITLNIIDGGYSLGARWGLFSPSSIISSGFSTTSFEIQTSYGWATSEYEKWTPLLDPANADNPIVTIHSADWSTSSTAEIDSISGNTVTLKTALAFTPSAGYIMELASYDSPEVDTIKAIYGFMINTDTFPSDGGNQYVML
jgi:hypothetical protein